MDALDLNLLRPLDALLRTRSVTHAARDLGLGQPTVSGILARLREQLGDPLLVRVGRQMELTPRAEQLWPEVHQILLRIDLLRQPPPGDTPEQFERHFSLMLSEFGLSLILPAVLRDMLNHAPRMTIDALAIDHPVASIYSGHADLCVTGEPIGDIAGDMAMQVRTRTLCEEHLVGLVDARHPLSGAIDLAQLIAYPHIAPQFPGSRRTVADISHEGLSHHAPPRLRVGGFLAIGHLVAGTEAIGLLPARVAALLARQGGLRCLTLPDSFRPIIVRMLWHARHDQDPAHRWLRATVAGACQALRTEPVSAIGASVPMAPA